MKLNYITQGKSSAITLNYVIWLIMQGVRKTKQTPWSPASFSNIRTSDGKVFRITN